MNQQGLFFNCLENVMVQEDQAKGNVFWVLTWSQCGGNDRQHACRRRKKWLERKHTACYYMWFRLKKNSVTKILSSEEVAVQKLEETTFNQWNFFQRETSFSMNLKLDIGMAFLWSGSGLFLFSSSVLYLSVCPFFIYCIVSSQFVLVLFNV